MNKDILQNILASQKADILNQSSSSFVARDIQIEKYVAEKEITVISGVRRCGKSSLLEQFLKSPDVFSSCLYCNFEDPQLIDFKASDFQKLYEIWIESSHKPDVKLAFFDEVQNVPGWEQWMNFFSKQKQFKVFVTGSNSNLISSELGTHLTGRHRQVTLFPLSFREILASKNNNRSLDHYTKGGISLEESIKLESLAKTYLEYGGFPRAWIPKDTSILVDYYQNILSRDIIRRKKIRAIAEIEKFGSAVMSNIGRKINKSKLAQDIGLKSGDTVEKYLRYFEESYLGIQIKKYDSSVRKQLRNQSKFYAIDSAMAARIGITSDSKASFYLENLVVIELLRRKSKVYYWESDKNIEVDFVVETESRTRQLIQVAWSIENVETKNREIRSFEQFALKYKNLKIHDRIIITMTGQKLMLEGNIKVIPFYLWALAS